MMRKSASRNSIEANATRLASPPERLPMRWSRRVSFNDDNTCFIFCSAFHASAASIAAIACSIRR